MTIRGKELTPVLYLLFGIVDHIALYMLGSMLAVVCITQLIIRSVFLRIRWILAPTVRTTAYIILFADAARPHIAQGGKERFDSLDSCQALLFSLCLHAARLADSAIG